MPLPREDTTPPVTKTYLVMFATLRTGQAVPVKGNIPMHLRPQRLALREGRDAAVRVRRAAPATPCTLQAHRSLEARQSCPPPMPRPPSSTPRPAAQLERMYSSPQVVAQRATFRQLLAARPARPGWTSGCGLAHLAVELARDVVARAAHRRARQQRAHGRRGGGARGRGGLADAGDGAPGDATALDLADASVDFVVAAQVLLVRARRRPRGGRGGARAACRRAAGRAGDRLGPVHLRIRRPGADAGGSSTRARSTSRTRTCRGNCIACCEPPGSRFRAARRCR